MGVHDTTLRYRAPPVANARSVGYTHGMQEGERRLDAKLETALPPPVWQAPTPAQSLRM